MQIPTNRTIAANKPDAVMKATDEKSWIHINMEELNKDTRNAIKKKKILKLK